MDQTLGKKERLSDKKDIDRLVREGKFRPGEGLRSCVLYDNGLDFSRILVSVPKKMFKRAVKRNLLKRRIREAYRRNKHHRTHCFQLKSGDFLPEDIQANLHR